MRLGTLLAIGMLGVVATESWAGDSIAGKARAFAADVLIVRGTNIRLTGVVAPADAMTCPTDSGEVNCSEVARDELEHLVAGRQVTCALGQKVGHGRYFGVCRLESGQDVAEALLRAGWLRAADDASAAYKAAEMAAAAAHLGLWANAL